MSQTRSTPLSLTLLRHGKAEDGDIGVDDFARHLAQRGKEEAQKIAHFMQRHDLKPDLVLCSSALRTKETLSELLEAGLECGKVLYEEDLYLTTAGCMLGRLEDISSEVSHCLVVGHNPGLHQLAGQLAVEGETRAIRELIMQFPPCSLAHFDFVGEISLGGELQKFITPAML